MRFRKRLNSWLTPALALVAVVALAAPATAAKPNRKHGRGSQKYEKLDRELKSRSGRLVGTSRVIITLKPGHDDNASQEVRKLGGRLGRKLRLIDGLVVELPNRMIKALSERSEVLSIHYDRPIAMHLNRAAAAVGARAATAAVGL